MSDERWIPVSGDGWNAVEAVTGADRYYEPELRIIGEAWWAAGGQRVETIHWCETHGHRANSSTECAWGSPRACKQITEATLIVPSVAKAEARESLLSDIEKLAKRHGWDEFYRVVSHAYDDHEAEHLNDPVRGEDWP